MKRLLAAFCVVWAIFLDPAYAADASDYGKLPALEIVRMSPSGQRYAFIVHANGKRQLSVLTADGQAVFGLGVGDIKVRNIVWADDNHFLIVVTQTENLQTEFNATLELTSALRVSIETKSIDPIFTKEPSVAPRVFGVYGTTASDGDAYGYFGGITLTRATGNRAAYVMGRTDIDLYRVNLKTGRTSLEARATPNARHNWLIAPNGRVAATSTYDTQKGVWRLHPEEGRNKPLIEKTSPLYEIGLIGLGRTEGTLLVLDQTGETDDLLEVSMTDGSTQRLLESYAIREYIFDQTTGLFVGAKLNDSPHVLFFDETLNARWKSLHKTFPNLRLELVSWNHDLSSLIIKTDGGRDSGTYWIIDATSGTASVLGYAYPNIRPPQVGPTQMFQYVAEDGLELEGVLTLPPESTGENLPLVVMPHGGPIGINDEVGFDWWAQAFAAQGYAVLQPNYRGSSGYTVAFRDAGFGEYGKKMLSDISDGVKALAAKGTIDPKRACIVGASYGGYAALAGVTIQQGLYRCAVSVSGISNVRSFFQWQMNRYGRGTAVTRYRRAVTGADTEGDSIMDTISPIRYAAQADAPVLLIHGKDDTVVPVSQSGAMADALESADKPVQLIRMEGEDHWLSRESTRMLMLQESLDFVLKHNPPTSGGGPQGTGPS